MSRSRMSAVAGAALLALTPYSLRADVRTDQRNRIEMAGVLGSMMNFFGGKAAREGVVSTVALKGDRRATIGEQTIQIVDLNEEKVYNVDLRKKSYKVTTFAELGQKLEEARRKAEENARHQAGDKNAQSGKPQSEPQIDFTIKETGQKKVINGFDTRETVLTVSIHEKGKTLEQSGGMVMTSDMWMTDALPGLKEIAAFQMRYTQKLQGPAVTGASVEQMAAAMAMYPQMKDAMARMSAEGAKLSGTAIQTSTTMDVVASAEDAAKQPKSGEEESKAGSPSGLGGLLGGLAKKASGKKTDDAGKGEGAQASGRASFMTMTSEVLKVSPEVSAADVSIPAGFKESK